MTRLASLVLPIALVVSCGGAPSASPLDAQEAAVAFLLNQRARQQPVCVQLATGSGDLVQGLVKKNLQDPSPESLSRFAAKGISISPFSTCRASSATQTVLRVGWPATTPDGYEVPVDLLCGPLGCDGGYRVHVKGTESGLRGVGARSTWVS